MDVPKEVWLKGSTYEPYVGRWSRLVAQEFLAWLDLAPGKRWLDVGCGTGALSQTIQQTQTPASITAVDQSADFIAFARSQVEQVEFKVGDAQALPVESGVVDVAVSGLVLNFIPSPIRAVEEMKRALAPGGVVAAYVWDYAGKMQLMRHFWNAAAALDPHAYDLDEGRRFPLCDPQRLMALFQAANLKDVAVRPIDIATDFQNFDDYWSPFLGGQGPAPGYTMALSEDQRNMLRERLRSALPFAIDGSIPLVARAWAVRGSH